MNSTEKYVTRGLLLASGLLAAGIAATILVAPVSFYAGYGIDVSADPSLANELSAPAGALLAAGLVMLAGALRPAYTRTSLAVAAVVYLSYGLSRLLSMAGQGMPNSALVSAAILELALGAVCLVGLARSHTGVGHSRRMNGRRRATS